MFLCINPVCKRVNMEYIFMFLWISPVRKELTHWGRVTHICISKISITGSDKGLSPGQRQAIIWSNAGILLIGPLGTNFTYFALENVVCEMAAILSQPQWVNRQHGGFYILVLCVSFQVAGNFHFAPGKSFQQHHVHGKQHTVINSLAPGRFDWIFRSVIFKLILLIDGCGISCNWPQVIIAGPVWWSIIQHWSRPSGNEPLPEPMLTQICLHMALLGLNELIIRSHWAYSTG